jgi:hypothetical protein
MYSTVGVCGRILFIELLSADWIAISRAIRPMVISMQNTNVTAVPEKTPS